MPQDVSSAGLALSDSHPLSEELSSLRAQVTRFQNEAHTSSIKLQRHALDTSSYTERTTQLEAENALLATELGVLRDNPLPSSSSSSASSSSLPFSSSSAGNAGDTVAELTLSLRRLSAKLSLTEDALLSHTQQLASATARAAQAEHAAEQAYALAARLRGREEEGRLREGALESALMQAREETRLSDRVVGEYAALVRKLEGRRSIVNGNGGHSRDTSVGTGSGSTVTLVDPIPIPTPTSTANDTPKDGLDTAKTQLASLVNSFASQLTALETRALAMEGERNVASAKLMAARTLTAELGEALAGAKFERELARVDDRSAAGMVERYMKFTQTTTTALHTSLTTLRTRHAATLHTLTTSLSSLTSRLAASEHTVEELRGKLDEAAGAVVRESVGRRREVAVRVRMVGREERVRRGLEGAVGRVASVIVLDGAQEGDDDADGNDDDGQGGGDEGRENADGEEGDAESTASVENGESRESDRPRPRPRREKSKHALALVRLVADIRAVLTLLDADLSSTPTSPPMSSPNKPGKAEADKGTEGRMALLEDAVAMLVAELEGEVGRRVECERELAGASALAASGASVEKGERVVAKEEGEKGARVAETPSPSEALRAPPVTDTVPADSKEEEGEQVAPVPPTLTPRETTPAPPVPDAVPVEDSNDKEGERHKQEDGDHAVPAQAVVPEAEGRRAGEEAREEAREAEHEHEHAGIAREVPRKEGREVQETVQRQDETDEKEGVPPALQEEAASATTAPAETPLPPSAVEAPVVTVEARVPAAATGSTDTVAVAFLSSDVDETPAPADVDTADTPAASFPSLGISFPSPEIDFLSDSDADAGPVPPMALPSNADVDPISASAAPAPTPAPAPSDSTQPNAPPLPQTAPTPSTHPPQAQDHDQDEPPPPPHPLLADLAAASKRYDALQRAFRDCHLALQELRTALVPGSDIPPQQGDVLRSAVERLHDYTEDARVELEIRVADGRVLARGWETIVGLPASAHGGEDSHLHTHENGRDGVGEREDAEKDVQRQVEECVARDEAAQAAFQQKLEDVEHDIAVVKRAVYAPPSSPSLASASEVLSPSPVSPSHSPKAEGWAAWLGGGGASGRRTPPSPGSVYTEAPTFGSVITNPRLRHSASAARLAQRTATPNVNLPNTNSGSGNPFDSLGLRVPMPAYVPQQAQAQQPQPQPQGRQRTISGVFMLGLGVGRAAGAGRRPSGLTVPRPGVSRGRGGDEGDVE
ncbi:hypothetical protein DFH06DRAFT_1376977 [Mycena polygramma]|nr:hypothetical protein DFH06DRAFT_1376977 [Mycena polygramma]